MRGGSLLQLLLLGSESMANFANCGRALVMNARLLLLLLEHSNTQSVLQGRIRLALVEGDEVRGAVPRILLQ